MFKVSKSGKGISGAALRYKRRWLKEQTGVKKKKKGVVRRLGGEAGAEKARLWAVIPQGVGLLRKKV